MKVDPGPRAPVHPGAGSFLCGEGYIGAAICGRVSELRQQLVVVVAEEDVWDTAGGECGEVCAAGVRGGSLASKESGVQQEEARQLPGTQRGGESVGPCGPDSEENKCYDGRRGQGWNACMGWEMYTTQRPFPYPQNRTSPASPSHPTQQVHSSVDVDAFGILTWEMYNTQRPFPNPQSFTSPHPASVTAPTTGQQQRGGLCVWCPYVRNLHRYPPPTCPHTQQVKQRGGLCVWYPYVGDVQHTAPLAPYLTSRCPQPPHNRSTAVWTFMHSAS